MDVLGFGFSHANLAACGIDRIRCLSGLCNHIEYGLQDPFDRFIMSFHPLSAASALRRGGVGFPLQNRSLYRPLLRPFFPQSRMRLGRKRTQQGYSVTMVYCSQITCATPAQGRGSLNNTARPRTCPADFGQTDHRNFV